jgi:transcriptional regulator with XRE-family HTH domain
MSALNIQTAARNVVRNTVNLRLESDVTISDMAAATKLSESTIRRIEKFSRLGALAGNYRPQLSTLVKLANAADVTPQDFITQELTVV